MTRAKKSLGQHFLTNTHTAERIVQAINADAGTIIEVGPGPGVLTDLILHRQAQLTFIEKDDRFAGDLSERVANMDNARVVHQDFLKVDLAELTSDPNTSLVGNFPYNISSQIVFRMLEYRNLFAEMIGMFQLEMARRIVAGPGSKDYSVISVLTQASYTGKIIIHVAPGQFSPPPKVKSAVIKLERKADYDPPCDMNWLRKVVKAAFNQRRKMLRNSLKAYFSGDPVIDSKLFNRRPEQVALEEFYDLANQAERIHQTRANDS